MRRIESYEIIDHGVEHSQYFQGCGISFTRFTDIATGIGNSPREALDDALEQLAQSDWDTDSNSELLEEVKAALSEDVIAEHLPDAECEHELHYFVSIRVK